MPSIDDVYNQLVAANKSLNQMNQQVHNLVTAQDFGDQVLVHLSNQTDTLICVLEKISRNTCGIWCETHVQTELQTAARHQSELLVELTKSAYPAAAVEVDRYETLKSDVAKCCPPDSEPPICQYEPCQAPEPIPSAPTKGRTN